MNPSSYDLRSSDRQPNGAESNINILDGQLAEIIFKFVPMCQWSSCLEYVSKKFRRCVKLAYGRTKFINLKNLFSLSKSTKTYGPTKLIFSKYRMTDRLNNILKKLLKVCPNLTGIIGFQYVTHNMKARSTWNILMKFNRLQSFSLVDIHNKLNVCYFADFVANCKSLTLLTICDCYFESHCTLNVGKLKSLEFNLLREPIFLENLSENLTTLEINGLRHYFKPDVCVENALKACVNLESFTVYLTDLRDKEIFVNILPNLSKLTAFCVSGDLNFDESFCVQLDLIKSQLKYVEFNRIEPSDEVQHFLLSKCVRLENYLGSLSTKALKNLTNLPGNLKQLFFEDTDGQVLPVLMPCLVKLSNFVDLTIQGEMYTKEWENLCCLVGLKKLRVLGGFVDDSLFEKWSAKNDKMFETLVVLEMRGCEGISDAGACLFAKKAVNLQILDLSYSKISDKTVSVLANVAKRLTTVDVAHCDQLVDENAILCLIEKAKRLKKLTIGEKLWEKLACLNGFLPFIEDVEIECIDDAVVEEFEDQEFEEDFEDEEIEGEEFEGEEFEGEEFEDE